MLNHVTRGSHDVVHAEAIVHVYKNSYDKNSQDGGLDILELENDILQRNEWICQVFQNIVQRRIITPLWQKWYILQIQNGGQTLAWKIFRSP